MDTQYRMLEPGEILIDGDEYRGGDGWKPYNYSNEVAAVGPVGAPVRPAGYYRRPLPASLLPEGIPPLPLGWLFYGRGPLLHRQTGSGRDLSMLGQNGEWNNDFWDGSSPRFYAIRAGTELARLNGLEPMNPASQVWTFRSEEPVLPFSPALTGRIEELEARLAASNQLLKSIGELTDQREF